MYFEYSSPRRAPLTMMPRTLFSQSDCMARVTESMVVVPMRTTSTVPEQSVDSRLASAANNKRRAVENHPVERARKLHRADLHLAQVQQFQRIDHSFACRKDVQIRPFDPADAVFDFRLAEKIVRQSRDPFQLEQVMNDRTPEIAVDQQRGVAFQLRLRREPDSPRQTTCLPPATGW